jgi:glycosyltransferase involved in cell wall biosynthesis
MNIQIEGTYENQYSLSIVNKALALALQNYLGANVKIDATTYHYDYMKSYEPIDTDIRPMVNKQLDEIDITIRNIFPPYTTGMLGYHKIMGPYAWEETKFPKEFVEWFNTKLTMIFAVSTFVKQILEENKVNIPIKVIGNIVEDILSLEALPLKYKLPNKFKILHISSCFPRKGADKLLEAFNSLELSNISLIIKTFPNPHNNLKDLIIDLSFKKVKEYEEDVELYRKDDKEILFINKDFSRDELKFLYENCDLFVFPSFSEGFGLPIAEAMLMNLPVITTSYGGQMDFCNEENSWLVDYELVQAKTHFELDESYWAIPSISSLKNKIIEVYNLDKNIISKKLNLAKQTILENYSSKAVANRVKEALENYPNV